MNETELKPCPFCGNKSKQTDAPLQLGKERWHQIYCSVCPCSMADYDENKLRTMWNTRTYGRVL
jgi:Lar family restriction alleviation protein